MTGRVSLCQQLANICLQQWANPMNRFKPNAPIPFKCRDKKLTSSWITNAGKIAKICA